MGRWGGPTLAPGSRWLTLGPQPSRDRRPGGHGSRGFRGPLKRPKVLGAALAGLIPAWHRVRGTDLPPGLRWTAGSPAWRCAAMQVKANSRQQLFAKPRDHTSGGLGNPCCSQRSASSIRLPLQTSRPLWLQYCQIACWTNRGKVCGNVGLNCRASIRSATA